MPRLPVPNIPANGPGVSRVKHPERPLPGQAARACVLFTQIGAFGIPGGFSDQNRTDRMRFPVMAGRQLM